MKLKLVKLEAAHQALFEDMMQEWKEKGEKIYPGVLRTEYRNFEELIEHLNDKEPELGKVPSDTYLCLDEERNIFVGAIALRHYLNAPLIYTGGHIGDGVRPSERNKGIATQMIAMALPKCRELGLDRVLITCEKDNIASAKTIIKNGGILENEVIGEEGKVMQRYWISLE